MLPNQPDAAEDVVRMYANLSQELAIKVEPYPSIEKLVNFKDNATMPIHRWYFFKEGYSHQLVKKFLTEFKIKKKSVVLDPFAGSGTTLLTSQWEGMRPVGIDVNPFFTFIERTKLDWHKYDLSDIEKKTERLSTIECKTHNLKAPELSSFTREKKAVFSSETLNQLLCYKEQIDDLEEGITRNFMRLGLASIMEPVSLIKKDGKGLKFVKGKKPLTVKEALTKKLNEMISDLNYVRNTSVTNSAIVGSSEGKTFNFDNTSSEKFHKNILPETVDFVMFSPPYLNSFDYTEVYKLELWFLDFVKNYEEFKSLRSRTLKSHNLWNWEPTSDWNYPGLKIVVDRVKEQKLWNKIIPVMIRGYFDGMYKTLGNLKRTMRKGAYCVIVVGNSCYGNIPIATDLLLTKAAQDVGLEPVEIRIARKLATSSQQLKTLKGNKIKDYLRESVIILKK